MKMELDVEIFGKINSRGLYQRIKKYGMNVMDLGYKTYVYGFQPLDEWVANMIIDICAEYGSIEVHKA